QVDRAKTEFVSLASHQLRTPLASINWTAEMLLSNDFGKVTKEQKNGIDTIRKSGKRMASLISALLNVSRIEMGSFEVNTLPVIIPDLIDESLKELETELNLKKAKFIKKYKKEVNSINADPVLLKIVVLNLLSNALRYCEKGSKITITLDKNTTDILFSVENKGIGIPTTDHTKIFTKLFRASNAQLMEPDGNGLGLYIVKSILDETGGKIWFESTENKNTKFFVTLPIKGMKSRKGNRPLEIHKQQV
ncbi:HAMP domain-containing histidine kinase, partial [Patescibacteria group bacterium]|nr:HAMP domain-containing histidine kinase [Patescibacteria group bacterium]